ncbi:MAG: hypothetical protein WD359_04265 [Dehalococcoidia bacterium]
MEPHQIKIVIEKHPDGHVGYPLGVNGVVIGQGDTFDEALAYTKSALKCHLQEFGKEELEDGR